MAERNRVPVKTYDGIKFSLCKPIPYYRCTKSRIYLHRYKYEKEVGYIPEGYNVHHIDNDPENNDLTNLKCVSKEEHSILHQIRGKSKHSIVDGKKICAKCLQKLSLSSFPVGRKTYCKICQTQRSKEAYIKRKLNKQKTHY